LQDEPDELISALLKALGGTGNKEAEDHIKDLQARSKEYLMSLAAVIWHDEPQDLPPFPTEIFPEGTGKPVEILFDLV
jgi:hypothetical protein